MEELIKLVMKKTGLPEAAAKNAVETVVNYLKEKLPAPLAGQVAGVLANEAASGQIENLTAGLGGMFGKKK
ncbi:MAG: DUF2267 domain-containing protein [Chloroflexota bacterium]|nr:DUF2267 domain-containing protein [Chloroflexota bacterium]